MNNVKNVDKNVEMTGRIGRLNFELAKVFVLTFFAIDVSIRHGIFR